MKWYRITLNIGVTNLLRAERWAEDDQGFRFFVGATEVAMYYRVMVLKIEDCTHGVPCRSEYETAA